MIHTIVIIQLIGQLIVYFSSPQSVHIQIKRRSPLEGMYCLDLIIELYSKGIDGLAMDNFIFNNPPKVKNNKFCYVIFQNFPCLFILLTIF